MTDRDTLTYLLSERARRPGLADTLDLHIAILEARAGFDVRDAQGGMRAEDAPARLARGEPLVRADDLIIDWNAFARLSQTICRIAARYRPNDADAFAELAAQFSAPARVEQLTRDYFRDTQHESRNTQEASISKSLISPSLSPSPISLFVLNNALHPFLAATARQLQPMLNDETWYRAYCPVCGGEPDFAALEKENGTRRLLCARCDGEWAFGRSACPFCGEDAPGKLGYYPGTEGVYRLYTCGNCRRYLKTIDLREIARDANLAAERVLTIAMDAAAREAGYC